MTIDIRYINDPSPVWDKISSYLTDDGWGAGINPNCLYAGVFNGDKMIGAFSATPINNFCYMVHGGLIKEYWGQGVDICRTAMNFFFETSTCLKIQACVPAYNRAIIRCLKAIDFTHEGVMRKAFVKNYKHHDLIIYGITKSEASRCQH